MKRTRIKRNTPLVSKQRLRSRSPKSQGVWDADEAWSQRVKKRAQGRCERCGAAGTDAHHVVYRRFKATRHMDENGVLLCRTCHGDAHDHPRQFLQWYTWAFPQNWEAIHQAKETK